MCHYAGNGRLYSIHCQRLVRRASLLNWVKWPHSDTLEAHIKIQDQINTEFIGTAVTHHIDKSIDCFELSQISIGPYKGVGVIRGFIRGLTQVLNDEATCNLRFCT